MKIDKNTQEVINEGETLRKLAESEGWKIMKIKLFEKLNDLVSVLGLDNKNKSPEQIVTEIGAKQLAAQILINWIREIEGKISQYKSNEDMLREVQKESHLRYFDEVENN